MAEALAALGGAAAASQFINYGFQITQYLSGLYGQMKDAPETIRIHWSQIQEVIVLVTLIKKNQTLQGDPSVSSVLADCILCAENIEMLLQKMSVTNRDGPIKRTKKKLLAVMKEKSTMLLFDRLEQHKSTLMICIQRIDS